MALLATCNLIVRMFLTFYTMIPYSKISPSLRLKSLDRRNLVSFYWYISLLSDTWTLKNADTENESVFRENYE